MGAGLAAVDLEPRTLEAAAGEFGSALDVDGVEGERRVYAAMSLGLAGGIASGEGPRPLVSDAFGECAETLSRQRIDERSMVEEATLRCRRRLDAAAATTWRRASPWPTARVRPACA